MSDMVYLYAALTVALVGLFGYLVYLHRRQSRVQSEVARLEALVNHDRK